MNTKRFFFVMLLVFVLSLGAAIGAVYYGEKFLKGRSQELSRLKAERDAQADVIARIKSASGGGRDLEALRELTSQVLPTEKRQAELVADILYTATAESGIPVRNIQNISFSGSAAPDSLSGAVKSTVVTGVYEYPFTIQIKTIPYQQLLALFDEIEKNKRIISVDNLQLTPSSANPNVLDSVSLSLKTYLKP